MPVAGRSSARTLIASALVIAIAACSEQAPLAPRADASRANASASSLASVGATRRLVALRDGRPATGVMARIRALGGTVTRSHESAGIVLASGLTNAAAQSLAQHPDVAEVLNDRMIQWIAPKALHPFRGQDVRSASSKHGRA